MRCAIIGRIFAANVERGAPENKSLGGVMGAVGGVKVLLSDNFNTNGPIDSATWRPNVGNGSFVNGTTQMRPELPVAQNGHLQLQFDTYNSGRGGPTYGGNASFYGSEAISQQTFQVGSGSSGIAFEARVRLPVAQDGLIGGFFTYGRDASTGNRDEIDWELIPKRGLENPQTNLFINVADGDGNWQAPRLEGVGLTEFHTYRIEWLPNAVRWLVDGEVVRTERDHLPTKAMALHFNLWGAGPTWDTGSSQLTKALTPGQNRTFFMEVDYTRVEQLATVVGDHLDNRLLGSGTADWMLGRGGNDVMRGGDGDDSMFGGRESDGEGGDTLARAAAPGDPKAFEERLYGAAGDDVVNGGGGREWLAGGSGDDTVRGGSGEDAIIGGRGIDRLFGGDDADQFIFRSVKEARPGDQLERLLDFNPRWGDSLDLSKIDADTNTPGNQAFAFIGDAPFTADPAHAGELRYEQVGNGIRVEADVDGDGEADMAFIINNVSLLSADDIIL